MPKPACYGEQYASAFQEASVARAYRHRPTYPPETFALLNTLIRDAPRRVLDVGCGTGFLARHMVSIADAVDALDVSAAMIAQGKACRTAITRVCIGCWAAPRTRRSRRPTR